MRKSVHICTIIDLLFSVNGENLSVHVVEMELKNGTR